MSIRSLEKRLDRANTKVSSSEDEIKSLKQDRDAAHQQLAIAYINSEELQREDEGVRDDLERVRVQLGKVTRQHQKQVEKLTYQELELRQKIERREKAVKDMSFLAKELWNTRSAIASCEKADPTTSAPTEGKQEDKKRKASMSCKSSHLSSLDTAQNSHGHSQAQTSESRAAKVSGRRTQSTSRASINVAKDVDDNDADSTTHLDLSGIYGYELSKDATYLSFMEGDEIAKLKKILEQDKAQLAKYSDDRPERISVARSSPRKAAVPRKSSLKDLNSRSKNQRVQYQDEDLSKQISIDDSNDQGRSGSRFHVIRDDNPLSTELNLDGSEKDETRQTVNSQRSDHRRRRSSLDQTENMTSALILPDITLSDAAFAAHTENAATAGNASQPLPVTETSKIHATVTRPTPVSSRLQPADVEDPTIRPAQSPAVALATVLHTLQSELAHLRNQLNNQEALYRQHDPALSKRKRKAVYERIRKLLAQIEVRSDQIYALYDVLEGQKESGMEMQEGEVEVTLQKFGLFGFETSGHGKKTKESARMEKKQESAGGVDGAGDDESNASEADQENDGPEAPWEGFDNTGTHTLESLRALGARVAA